MTASSVSSADDSQARAAKAFDDGQRAFAAGAYRKAAVNFEEAYAASPHPATLFNAAKARARAGDFARAATLYARIEVDSPSPRDREDARTAREALLPKIGRVQVTGEFDAASVDGDPVQPTGPSFVQAGEHVVTGQREGRTLRKVVTVAVGTVVEVTLGASDAAPAPMMLTPAPVVVKEEPPRHHGVPRVVTYILGGATIVAAGVSTWSGVDTLAQKTQFNRSGADLDLDSGLSKQTRTNVLFGVTAGLAVITGVVAIFTDWN